MVKIAIIGVGIIGLTSACRILELIPDASITIYAETFSPNTTSDVSAGYWEPYCISPGQSEQILKWGKETYDRMLNSSLSKEATKLGVQPLNAYILQDSEETRVPYWSTIVSQFHKLNQTDILNTIHNQNTNLKSGFSFLSTTVVVNKYLPELVNKLINQGVKFVKTKLETLNKFISNEGDSFDYIVNCTGLGAKDFVPDKNVYAVKGQVIRVKAPWIKYGVLLENEVTYILPLCDTVVLGGTQETVDLNPNEAEYENLLKRCIKIFPSLKDAEIVSKQTGYRPCRTGGVRLEMEYLGKVKVIHNYGHGGSGVTLSWGCASNVVQLIIQDMKGVKSKL